VPGLGWLAAAACGCVLLAMTATVLLRQNDPALVRLTVNHMNQDDGPIGSAAGATARTPAVRAIGQGIAESAWHSVLAPTADTAGGAVGDDGRGPGPAAAPTASGRAGARQPGAAGSAGAGGAGAPEPGVSQAPKTLPAPAPGPRPRPSAGQPFAVTDLTLALVGGDKGDPEFAYVITVSTDGPNPVTLTIGYPGPAGAAAVTRTVVLSGQTEYALAATIPGQPYCGTSLTMRAATSPAAGNGAVSATSTPGC
jgi:hypothetical protein